MKYKYIEDLESFKLDNCITMDITEPTTPIIEEFMKSGEEYLIIENFLLVTQEDLSNQKEYSCELLLSKSIPKDSDELIQINMTLTELKELRRCTINLPFLPNELEMHLREYYITDENDILIPKENRKAIIIELDFIITIRAQGNGRFGQNVGVFFIDKVLYYL